MPKASATRRPSRAPESQVETESDQKNRWFESMLAVQWRNIYGLVPMALAVLASLNTLWNGFVHDDNAQVLNNSFITDLRNLPLAFTSSVWSFLAENIRSLTDVYFRPIFTAQFMINYAIFGTKAWGWHLMNVLIHAAVSLLVFVILKHMTGRNWLALATACLFAVHPVHAESVAWISGVTDPLMTLFFLSAFLFFLRYQENGRKYLLAVSLVFYLLAVLTKETALVLPVLIAYYEMFYKGDGPLAKRFTRAAAYVGVYALPTLLYFFLRYQAIGGALTGQDSVIYPVIPALLTIPSVVVKYIFLLLVPINYNFQHYTPFAAATSLSFIVPLAILIVATVGILRARSRDLAFAAVWFLLGLAPVLVAIRLLHPISMVQERYLYLPSIGGCFALMLGVEWLANRKLFSTEFGRLLIVGSPAALIIVFGVLNIEQNTVWHDNLRLFRRCVVVNPKSPFARNALATSYWLSGKPHDAEVEARTAIDLDPTCTDAYVNLCYFVTAAGKFDQGIQYLQQARASLPEGPERRFFLGRVHHDLGLLYEKQEKLDLAEENLKVALDVLPTLPHKFDLGEFYFDHGRYDEALALFEEVEGRVPAWFAPIHLRLARTFDRMGQKERARSEYEQYLELSPRAKDYNEVRRRLTQL